MYPGQNKPEVQQPCLNNMAALLERKYSCVSKDLPPGVCGEKEAPVPTETPTNGMPLEKKPDENREDILDIEEQKHQEALVKKEQLAKTIKQVKMADNLAGKRMSYKK